MDLENMGQTADVAAQLIGQQLGMTPMIRNQTNSASLQLESCVFISSQLPQDRLGTKMWTANIIEGITSLIP